MSICALCDSTQSLPVYSKDGYTIVRCEACGLMYVDPVPDDTELAQYYRSDFLVDFRENARSAARKADHLLDRLESVVSKGRLLEIGCSYGFFLDAARRRGWQVCGVELSRDASRYGRDVLGLETFSTLEEGPQAQGTTFDAVMLRHVLEHLPRPSEYLRLIRTCLKPNGVLLGVLPNIDSLEHRILRSSWSWISPPAHLYYYSPGTLRGMLRKHGFDLIYLGSGRGDSLGLLHDSIMALARLVLRSALQFRSQGGRLGSDETTLYSMHPGRCVPRTCRRVFSHMVELFCLPFDSLTWPLRCLTYERLLGPEMTAIASVSEYSERTDRGLE